MSSPVSSVVNQRRVWLPVLVRPVRLSAIFATFVLCGGLAHAAVNVYFTKESEALQEEFISKATAQYEHSITESPYFPGTFTLSIFGVNPDYEPPAPSSPIADRTAFDQCFVHGWVFGMEQEREDDLNLLLSLRSNIYETNTCGGFVSTSTDTLSDFLNGCETAYIVAGSTITQRNGEVFVPPVP